MCTRTYVRVRVPNVKWIMQDACLVSCKVKKVFLSPEFEFNGVRYRTSHMHCTLTSNFGPESVVVILENLFASLACSCLRDYELARSLACTMMAYVINQFTACSIVSYTKMIWNRNEFIHKLNVVAEMRSTDYCGQTKTTTGRSPCMSLDYQNQQKSSPVQV